MDRSIRQRAKKVSAGEDKPPILNFPPTLPLKGIATNFPKTQPQGGAGFDLSFLPDVVQPDDRTDPLIGFDPMLLPDIPLPQPTTTSPDQLRQPLLSDEDNKLQSVTTFITRIIDTNIELSDEDIEYGESITIPQFQDVFNTFFNKDGGGAYILKFVTLATKLGIQWEPKNKDLINGLVELKNINTRDVKEYQKLKQYIQENRITFKPTDFDQAAKGQGDKSQYEIVAKELGIRWPTRLQQLVKCVGNACNTLTWRRGRV
jgi:hypothetical protein